MIDSFWQAQIKALRRQVSHLGRQLRDAGLARRGNRPMVAFGHGHKAQLGRAQQALRESEHRYRALFEQSNDAVVIHDLDGHIFDVNGRACILWGYTRQEMLARTIQQLAPTGRFDKPDGAMQAVRREGSVLFETQIRTAGGAIVDVEISAAYVDRERGIIQALVRDISARKRDQNALRDREERMRAVISAVHDVGMFVVDYDGRMTFVHASEELERKYGMPARDCDGKRVDELYAPEEARKRLEMIREVFRTNQPIRTEMATPMPLGLFWQEVTLSPMCDDQGRVQSVLIVLRDIHERKLAQEALREQGEQLRAIIAGLQGMMLVVVDGSGQRLFVHISPELESRYQIRAADLVGVPVQESYDAQEVTLRLSYLRGIMETGEPLRVELTTKYPGGTFFQEATCSPIRGPGGEVIACMAVLRDITEQKKAQEALRQSKEQLQYIIDNTSEIIFQIDLEGRFTFGNKAVQRVAGYRVEELLGRNWLEITAPEYHAIIQERLTRRKAGQSLPQPLEYEIIDRQGRRIMLELTTTGVYEGDKLVAVQGIARDITERRRSQQALRKARQMLVHAREEERRRLAGELHDSIGQGLVALQLSSRVLADWAPAGEEFPLPRLGDQVDALIREVRGICHGLYPASLESLGLRSALTQLERDFQGQTQVVTAYRVAGDGRLDREVEIALFRISQEACANAIRHGKARRVEVEVTYEPGRAILEVRDDGGGFNTCCARTGLGLSLMKERTDTVGGDLFIDSSDKGTTVRAVVPSQLHTQPLP